MLTKIEIIESMQPSLKNAIYLIDQPDLSEKEQEVVNWIVRQTLDGVNLEKLTESDKRLALKLINSLPKPKKEVRLEDLLSPELVAKLSYDPQ